MNAAAPSSVPTLGRRELAEALSRLHSDRHRVLHSAYFGRADRDLQSSSFLEAKVVGTPTQFRVEEVGSELAFRRALSQAAPEEWLVLLVGYGLDVPHDIAARIARGHVLQVDRARRVAARFNARGVSPEVLAERPLVDALLDEGGQFDPIPGYTVELETAWRALLRRLTGEGSLDIGSEEQVAAFVARSPGGPDLALRLRRWGGLESALQGWIGRTAGRLARLAWRAYEDDKGVRFAAMAFVLDAVCEDLASNGFLRGRLASELVAIDPELAGAEVDRELMKRWGGLASKLALQLDESLSLKVVYAEAGRILSPGADADPSLAKSRYLPYAFTLAQDTTAEALRSALDRPGDRGALETAIAAAKGMEEHRSAQAGDNRLVIERSRMALRLLVWRELMAQGPLNEARQGPEADRAPALAAWYAREGAFVDFARATARGPTGDALGRAISSVVGAIDSLRDSYDEAFAQALPAYLGRSRTTGAVAIEDALDRFAVPFLAGGSSRKLLVLLMDGMAWANACELLLDLENHGVGPTVHQLGKDGRTLLEPMLAALPTLTEVSRSAFFAGKLSRPGETLSTAGDPERFSNHKGLLGVLGGRTPRLLLSAEVDDASGGASAKARDLILSDERAVALVLNAIDDTLKAGTQTRFRSTVDDIRPLRDLIQAARAAGRAILLVSDHGHVPGARLQTVPAPKPSGARYRALSEGEKLGPRELRLSGERVWRPKGKEAIALLWSETESYSSAAREGEHGGASLAEVVAPAVFVAHEGLAEAMRLQGGPEPAVDGLEVTAYPKPSFWSLDLPKAVTTAPVPRKKREPKSDSAQVPMPFAVAAPRPPKVEVAAGTVPEVELLTESAVFKAMLERRPKLKDQKDRILRAVAVLFEGEGRLAPDLFAARTGTLPTRVTGFVSIMQEALNVEGMPVVVYDTHEKLVKLDRDTFRAIFKEG